MDINSSMYAYMQGYARKTDCTAYSFRSRRVSREAFTNDIVRIAVFLQKNGIGKGDTVALCLPNIPQAVVALYAVNLVGAVANLIHPKTNPSRIKAFFSHTNTKIAFIFAPLALQQAQALEGRRAVICGDCERLLTPLVKNSVAFGAIKADGQLKPIEVEGEDIAVYMHSGGTLGEPKTAMLSNRAVNALVENMFSTIGKPYGDKHAMLAILPMFHGFGLAVSIHAVLCARIKLVLVPRFAPKKIAGIIKSEKITIIAGIPRMFEKMLYQKNFKGSCLKTLEDIYCGGDYLREEIKTKFEARMRDGGAHARFCQGYGLTEMASVCMLNLDNTPCSIGKPFNNVEMKLVDENGNEADRGTLWLSGTQCMSGYLDDAEATERSLVREDGKLWLNTGDVVERSSDGHYKFADREKRIIKISGINVFPSMIETTARRLEFVRDACAVEKRLGGKPYIVLFITLSHSVDNYEKPILDACRSTLSRWFVPKRVVVLNSLPTTAMGKTDVKFLERLAENVSV